MAARNWLVLLSFPLSAAPPTFWRVICPSHLPGPGSRRWRSRSPVPSRPRRLPSARRANAVVPLYFLAVAVPRQGVARGSAISRRSGNRRDLVKFLRRNDRGRHDPGAVAAYWFCSISLKRSNPSANATGCAELRHGGSSPVHRRCGDAHTRGHLATTSWLTARRSPFPRRSVSIQRQWWSYLVPPVENPLFGAVARQCGRCRRPRRAARTASQPRLGNHVALASSRVSCGSLMLAPHRRLKRERTGVLHLPPVARGRADSRHRRGRGALLFAVAGADHRRFYSSGLLPAYTVVPMFRSYARFGVVVQLMARCWPVSAWTTRRSGGLSGCASG